MEQYQVFLNDNHGEFKGIYRSTYIGVLQEIQSNVETTVLDQTGFFWGGVFKYTQVLHEDFPFSK